MTKTSYLTISLLALLAVGCSDTRDKKLAKTQEHLDSLSMALEREKELSDSLQDVIRKKDSTAGGYPVFFGRKYDGIEDPEQFIKDELAGQTDLIPLDPVLGGNMEFRKVDILTEKWLLAIYDDGHVQGKSIIEYQLQPNGELEFELVATQE